MDVSVFSVEAIARDMVQVSSQSAALVAEKLAYYNVCEQTAAGTVARRVQDGEHLKKPSQVRHNEAVRILTLRYGALPKKISGSLAGVPLQFTVVGRARLRVLGLHSPIMAGIAYDEQSGTVFSVVESGGYADDEDLGDVIWYIQAFSSHPLSFLYGKH